MLGGPTFQLITTAIPELRSITKGIITSIVPIAATITTTLSELNRLFGLYREVAAKNTPNSEEASKAWIAYETYARRYNGHIRTTLPQLASSCSRATADTSHLESRSIIHRGKGAVAW